MRGLGPCAPPVPPPLMVTLALPCVDELWITCGTDKNYRYIPACEIAASLPVFHALTGCYTVSAFVGHEKKPVWATWNSFPELNGSFVTLTTTPVSTQDGTMDCSVQDDAMHIERLVVRLCGGTSPSWASAEIFQGGSTSKFCFSS